MLNTLESKVYNALLPFIFVFLILCNLLAAPVIGSTEATFSTATDALVIREVNGTDWAQTTRLNIFNQADNTDRVIAPFSSGSYTFTIENTARFPFTYSMDITEENLAGIPMRFRLRDHSGEFIIGNEAEWETISLLQNITGELANQTSAEYTLDWIWPGSDNTADTASGVFAQKGAVYTLNFNIHAEQSGDAVDPDHPAQTSDPAALSLFISLMFISMIVLAALLIPVIGNRRKR